MNEQSARKIINILLSSYIKSENTSYWLVKDFAMMFHGFADIAKQMYLGKYGKTKFFQEE